MNSLNFSLNFDHYCEVENMLYIHTVCYQSLCKSELLLMRRSSLRHGRPTVISVSFQLSFGSKNSSMGDFLASDGFFADAGVSTWEDDWFVGNDVFSSLFWGTDVRMHLEWTLKQKYFMFRKGNLGYKTSTRKLNLTWHFQLQVGKNEVECWQDLRKTQKTWQVLKPW